MLPRRRIGATSCSRYHRVHAGPCEGPLCGAFVWQTRVDTDAGGFVGATEIGTLRGPGYGAVLGGAQVSAHARAGSLLVDGVGTAPFSLVNGVGIARFSRT